MGYMLQKEERRMGGGNVSQDQTSIICIDLKSFYASVECVERGLDPFKANLVVADPTRSKSTICLAITPAMKSLGIKNRCRIHEIPDCVKYITAMPRMQLYMDYSAKIYGIYLRYVSKEDIHVYSVDECFIDVTNYLQLYHLTAKEMAVKLMQEVMEETGITATAGVGTNLYLAKIAMDIVAKHVDDHIGILDEFSYREKLWDHKPLSDFWRIGSRTEKKLAGYGIHTMGDIAMASLRSEDWLYKMFGIDAELLIDHAWGYETCRMSDIKNYHSEEHSLSNGQVLMRNYSFDEALVIVREMTDNLVLDLFEKGLVTSSLTLWIAYDHRYEHEASKGTVKLERESNSSKKIMDAVEDLYLR
ncbi:MAG: DNA repair protein, partial [Blautia wexlerae]